MSLEKSRFVYRCAFVVDLLLSGVFTVLSGIALTQQETFFRKMVVLCAIPYFVLVMIATCIAIWAALKKRERGICVALQSEDDLFAVLPCSLVVVTILLGLSFLIASLVEFEYPPLSIFLIISTVHLGAMVMILVLDKAIGDDRWQSLGEYTALGNDVPIVHNTADTPNQ
jgi:hypothetical protein